MISIQLGIKKVEVSYPNPHIAYYIKPTYLLGAWKEIQSSDIHSQFYKNKILTDNDNIDSLTFYR